MSTEVMCIGIACVDVLLRGVNLSVPFKAESKHAECVALGVGGDATNQAIILTKLGVGTKLMTGIGSDTAGDFIKTTIERAGVDMSETIYVNSSDSCINIIVVDPSGQRNFINAGMPESARFTAKLEAIKDVKIVSIGSMMVPPFTTAESISRVVQTAKRNGSIVCADVVFNYDACTLKDLENVLPMVDYMFPNEEEASALTGKSDLDEMADVFLSYGVKNIIIKIGKEGCFVKNATKRMIVPAIGNKVVDTTGAGDNFAAGFITALLDEKPIEECCRFAAGTAGIAIQHIGANTGVKSRQQVEKFLEENL